MSTYEAEIRQVASDVFEAMLRCAAEPAEDRGNGGNRPDHRGGLLRRFLAGRGFAGMLPGRRPRICFPVDANQSIRRDDDARDALGEIVNMIGGNLKSVLPHGVGLSLPSVVKGKDYAYRICGNNRRERPAFDSCAGKFCVTLLQTVPGL